jgi:hypothetical protein
LNNYVLIGQTPVPEPDLLTWARSFEYSERRVAFTRIMDLCEVSTVFLGIDHNFRGGGPPLLFETMVFWSGNAWEQRRCSTWKEAECQHALMVWEARRPGAVAAWMVRTVAKAFEDAWSDLRGLWWEI